MTPRPVFVLSLPRSGSTLLQRLVAAHPTVATHAEPHALLPLLFARRRDGVLATYEHAKTAHGIDDLVASVGEAAWEGAVRAFARELHTAVDPTATHFVDKTPRYVLAWRELHAAFPDATFVLLLRHPLACAASVLRTWGDGRFRLQEHVVDLVDGVRALGDAHEELPPERTITVTFEQLTNEPRAVVASVHTALGLRPHAVDLVDVPALRGSMGDPGRHRHAAVLPRRDDAWAEAFAGPVRRAWARAYVEEVGAVALAALGVNVERTHQALDRSPSVGVGQLRRDAVDVARSSVARRLQSRALRDGWGRGGRTPVLLS